jgi:hypothetical protein
MDNDQDQRDHGGLHRDDGYQTHPVGHVGTCNDPGSDVNGVYANADRRSPTLVYMPVSPV